MDLGTQGPRDPRPAIFLRDHSGPLCLDGNSPQCHPGTNQGTNIRIQIGVGAYGDVRSGNSSVVFNFSAFGSQGGQR